MVFSRRVPEINAAVFLKILVTANLVSDLDFVNGFLGSGTVF
jgi:hypothetical protein